MSARKRQRAGPSEEAQHILVARWLGAREVLWCHPPNGGHRSARTGARLKAMGVSPGVPDFLVFTPPPRAPGYVGTAIELKAAQGCKVTAPQCAWLYNLTACRWYAAVCYGGEAAIEQLLRLGY